MKLLRNMFVVGGLSLAFYSAGAAAQLTNQGMLDQVVTEFATHASSWQTVVMNAALWLFWTLGTISLVWTFGMMALRKADIAEFFAEFIRFIVFFGFFLWLLKNGPEFAASILQSLQKIGEQASGISSVSPSGIVDIGFMIWKQAIGNLSLLSPVDSFVGVVMSIGILLLLAAVGVNILLIWVSGWILMYAGVFFLGFGGSRWTSDMAINYYKTVLGIAAQLMVMVLLVGIGDDLLTGFYAKMNKGALNFEELGIMLVFCFALLMLINKVPSLVSGIITGAGVGHSGIGSFGAGAMAGMAMGAAGMATSAAGMAGSMVASGASEAAGGAQAVMAAFSKVNENMQSGSESLAGMWGDGNGSSGGSSGSNARSETGDTPLAQASGRSSSSGSWSSGSGGTPSQSGGSQSGGGKSNGSGDTQTIGGGRNSSGSGGSTQKSSSGAERNKAATGGEPGSSGLMAAAKITANAGANLMKGATIVAQEKASSIKESAMGRIAETTGGKIAAVIGSMGSNDAPTFAENSLSGETQVDREAEIAAFVNRDTRPA